MTGDRQSGRFSERVPAAAERQGHPAAGSPWLVRSIQVALALYLIPALLVVLVVGGIGMLVLAAARLLTALLRRWSGESQTPGGPASDSP